MGAYLSALIRLKNPRRITSGINILTTENIGEVDEFREVLIHLDLHAVDSSPPRWVDTTSGEHAEWPVTLPDIRVTLCLDVFALTFAGNALLACTSVRWRSFRHSPTAHTPAITAFTRLAQIFDSVEGILTHNDGVVSATFFKENGDYDKTIARVEALGQKVDQFSDLMSFEDSDSPGFSMAYWPFIVNEIQT